MKIKIVTFVCLIFSLAMYSQQLKTRSGEIKFEATMPSFEQIAAKNNTVSCIFDTATGKIAALALIKEFRFKLPLMEEHFNENYIESDQFPKATFKGEIIDFELSKLSSSKTIYDLEGELTMHGVTKRVKTKISLAQNAGKINAVSVIPVKLKDYAIEVPSLVKSKIAENVKVSINFILEAK
jgi:hypothetical protein